MRKTRNPLSLSSVAINSQRNNCHVHCVFAAPEVMRKAANWFIACSAMATLSAYAWSHAIRFAMHAPPHHVLDNGLRLGCNKQQIELRKRASDFSLFSIRIPIWPEPISSHWRLTASTRHIKLPSINCERTQNNNRHPSYSLSAERSAHRIANQM